MTYRLFIKRALLEPLVALVQPLFSTNQPFAVWINVEKTYGQWKTAPAGLDH